MTKLRIFIALTVSFTLSGCTFFYAKQYPDGGTPNLNFASEATCKLTELKTSFITEAESSWKINIQTSATKVTEMLRSPEFAHLCQESIMNRTKGKTVQEVCREIVCAGTIELKIGFYNKANTLAIAYEEDGILYINTAKFNEDAGSPGNIAHEFTHTLGYTHFTNWAFLGKGSVPYVVGNIINSLYSI